MKAFASSDEATENYHPTLQFQLIPQSFLSSYSSLFWS